MRCKLHRQFTRADRRICLTQAKLFTWCLFVRQLQERVVVQHLVYLLAEFQGGELQQTNGLLQLRGERQVLRYAKGEALFHVVTPLHLEMLAQVHPTHVGVVHDLGRGAFG